MLAYSLGSPLESPEAENELESKQKQDLSIS